MAIEIDFIVSETFDFAQTFAERFNLRVIGNQVNLPETLGSGFIREVDVDHGIRLCLHQYQLKQPFVLNRLASSPQNTLTIKFDGSRFLTDQNGHRPELLFTTNRNASVELATSNLFARIKLPAHQHINFLVITIARQTLLDLLCLPDAEQPVRSTLAGNESFVFHETMTSEMERILIRLSAVNESTPLANLLYQTKAYELIYLLFAKLLARSIHSSVSMNQADVEKMYALKASLLTDLSQIPQLPQLARNAGMSQTKMQQLFRQIFGDSVYNYYQSVRMNEAARLLATLSVAETGYQLGFTNLSHFSRLFQKHYSLNPKQYKRTLKLPAP